MRFLAILATVAIVLSGCASDERTAAFNCPEEYGAEFPAMHDQMRAEYRNQTGKEIPDADRDCVPDPVEVEFGTDPDNATDYPSVDDFLEAGEPEPQHKVSTGSGTILVGSAALAVGQGGGEFEAAKGATLIYAEFRWDTPVVDLNGALASPSAGSTGGVPNFDHTNSDGLPGQPDNPHSLTINAPETGTWAVTMFPNGATANTAYDYAVTVFYGATSMPDGYTAFS